MSPRFGTPIRTSIFTGIAVALIATFVPLTELAELVNIGTLFAFVLVAAKPVERAGKVLNATG